MESPFRKYSSMLLKKEDLDSPFEYPIEFKRLLAYKIIYFKPWQIILGDELLHRFKGLRQRYPTQNVVPFATRLDNDDVACWDLNRNSGVCVISDFESKGFEYTEFYGEFGKWFEVAMMDFIDFEDDEEHYPEE
jgi:hypothetical protein